MKIIDIDTLVTSMLLCGLLFLVGLVCYKSGQLDEAKQWKDELVKRGYAEYVPILVDPTVEFQWKEKKENE